MDRTKHSKETPELSVLRQPWMIASIVAALAIVVAVAIACVLLRPANVDEASSTTDEDSILSDSGATSQLPTYRARRSSDDLQAALEEVQSKPKAAYTQSVEEELQFPLLPGGCEISALASVLHAYGFDVSATDLADSFLNLDEEDAAASYFGTPYGMGGGFPPAIAATAESYLEQGDTTVHAIDLSGQDYEKLLQWVDSGYPVLVWTTMYQDYPLFTDIMVGEYEWYDNEHCVVLYGHSDDVVQVMDPLEGLTELDAQTFASLYDECGKCSIVIA